MSTNIKNNFDLLSTVESGGCSAKIPAQALDDILKKLKVVPAKDLLVGHEHNDDAAVWKINNEQAIVQTTDFFPPMCSDPYTFGQIAASNSLSDIYAMGAKPFMALNLVMFPSDRLDIAILDEILRGGAEKLSEASVTLCGGHSINDYPPKFGMVITGMVHPDRVIANNLAQAGDVLLLTKPIGTGAIMAGKKLELVTDEQYLAAIESMKKLNKHSGEIIASYNIKCATDITGFGLVGHAMEIAKASNVTIRLETNRVPLFDGVVQLHDQACISGATFRNLRYCEKFCSIDLSRDYAKKIALFDAQTSGGFLICCPVELVNTLLSELEFAVVVGSVTSQSDQLVEIV